MQKIEWKFISHLNLRDGWIISYEGLIDGVQVIRQSNDKKNFVQYFAISQDV